MSRRAANPPISEAPAAKAEVDARVKEMLGLIKLDHLADRLRELQREADDPCGEATSHGVHPERRVNARTRRV